jgi:hypothetical protein
LQIPLKEGTRGENRAKDRVTLQITLRYVKSDLKNIVQLNNGSNVQIRILFQGRFSFSYLITLGCLTSPTFSFCNEPIWLVHAKKKLKLWKILWKDGVPLPLAHVYRWEGEDFEQNISDESEVLLGTPLGNKLGA